MRQGVYPHVPGIPVLGHQIQAAPAVQKDEREAALLGQGEVLGHGASLGRALRVLDALVEDIRAVAGTDLADVGNADEGGAWMEGKVGTRVIHQWL